MHVPAGFSVVTPYLVVDGAEAYVRFLEAALGGEEVLCSRRPDGVIANSQVRFGTATIMVSDSVPGYPATCCSLYFYVENADAAMARALDNGAVLEMLVRDMPYGDRQGGIRDPAGNIWWISQRLTGEPYSV